MHLLIYKYLNQYIQEELEGSCPGAKLIEGRILSSRQSESDLKKWVDSLSY